MIKSTKRKKPPASVYQDYYARIQRQSLRYGISHYVDGYSTPKPYSRHLELHGEMLWPEQLRGLSFTADLIGDPGRIELPKAFEGSAIASLRKREEKVWLTTFVPIEFIPSLSAAYHDDCPSSGDLRQAGAFGSGGFPAPAG